MKQAENSVDTPFVMKLGDLKPKLYEIAVKEDRSIAYLIRKAIKEYLAKHPEKHIGVVK